MRLQGALYEDSIACCRFVLDVRRAETGSEALRSGGHNWQGVRQIGANSQNRIAFESYNITPGTSSSRLARLSPLPCSSQLFATILTSSHLALSLLNSCHLLSTPLMPSHILSQRCFHMEQALTQRSIYTQQALTQAFTHNKLSHREAFTCNKLSRQNFHIEKFLHKARL